MGEQASPRLSLASLHFLARAFLARVTILRDCSQSRKCNPWLHFTPQWGLALGERSGKISTPGCGPPDPPDLYSTQEGHPSWFPLVPSDWGIWASPTETDRDSCPGWLPPVPLDLVSPREGFSPGPLTPSLKPCHKNFAHYFLYVFCVVPGIEPLCETTCQLEEFIKKEIFSILTTVFKNHNNSYFSAVFKWYLLRVK